ncbi:spon1 [Bugula neritina]|uniref:Spon1 n=2 Tax=Bugula neritina TaxID=10212 RepID=A0A7J7IW67_BUGNE|nr:spon1 [Bugula neritina]
MGKCRHFEYTGCRGNANNFDTLEDCVSSCGTVEGGSPVAAGDVDCMLTEWSAFSSCSVTCGTGLKSRSRQIKRRNSGNGAMCPKSTTQTEVCTLDDCPAPSPTSDVDCMLSEWSAWSLCSETCGDGVQARQRMVKRPAQGQGQPCDPNVKEMRSCNLSDCHPYCMLSPWGDWSKCSVACGVGKRMRRRMEKRGPCPVDTQYTEMEPCQGSLCQDANCVISEWTAWTPCDALCGVMGTQTRFRMIVQPASEGGTCPLSDPKEMEMRACYNGPCTDATSTTESTQENLPVDCQVGDWGEWSACSKSCGTGRQVRRRSVTIKRKNHGARCPPLKEVQHCDNAVKCRKLHRTKYGHVIVIRTLDEYLADGGSLGDLV